MTSRAPGAAARTVRPTAFRSLPYIADGRAGKRVTPWWLAYILVFVVLVFIVQFGLMGIFTLYVPTVEGSPEWQWLEGISNLVPAILAMAWVVLFERRSLSTFGFRRPGRGVLLLLAGIPLGAAIISTPILILLATGQYELIPPPTGAIGGWQAAALAILLVVPFIAQGGNEEVLIRGLLLQSSSQRLPAWAAIVLPALLFTLMHGVLTKPIGFTTIMMYALFAAFVVLRLGSLWLIIGIHAGWNWAEGNVWGVQVSGAAPKTTSILYTQPTSGSSDLLTGATFGPEGGIPAALLLIALAAVAFVLFRRRLRAVPAAV